MHGSKLLIPGVTTTSKGSNSSGLLHLRPLQKPFKRRKDWTNCQTYIAAWNPGFKRNFKKMKSKLTISVPLSLAFKCPLLASRFCSRKVYTKYIALYKFLCITLAWLIEQLLGSMQFQLYHLLNAPLKMQ